MTLPTFLFLHSKRTRADPWFIKTDWTTDLFNYLVKRRLISNWRVCWVDRYLQDRTGQRFRGYESVEQIEILPTDIVWLRGPAEWWQPLTQKLQHHSVISYRAGKRPAFQGDYELDDFSTDPNLILYKPASSLFKYQPIETDYDFCLGGNISIYDNKGQYKSYLMTLLYDQLAQQHSRSVVPGKFLSNKPQGSDVLRNNKSVDIVESMSREDLNILYNRSKIFVSSTRAGQNDRCVIEALSAGCPVLIHKDSCQYFPPYLLRNRFIRIFSNDNPLELLDSIKHLLSLNRKRVAEVSRSTIGVERAATPFIKILVKAKRGPK